MSAAPGGTTPIPVSRAMSGRGTARIRFDRTRTGRTCCRPRPEIQTYFEQVADERGIRPLEGRWWWRRDVGGKMVRFVVCRKGVRHVIAARDDDMLMLQRVAPQVGLAGMVTTVLGSGRGAALHPPAHPAPAGSAA